jgi:hypothetical protein
MGKPEPLLGNLAGIGHDELMKRIGWFMPLTMSIWL